MKSTLAIISTAFFLVACGEKPQALETNKHDSAAYTGTGKAFANPDWKQGDKTSWESHMKARMERGQNDYVRMN